MNEIPHRTGKLSHFMRRKHMLGAALIEHRRLIKAKRKAGAVRHRSHNGVDVEVIRRRHAVSPVQGWIAGRGDRQTAREMRVGLLRLGRRRRRVGVGAFRAEPRLVILPVDIAQIIGDVRLISVANDSVGVRGEGRRSWSKLSRQSNIGANICGVSRRRSRCRSPEIDRYRHSPSQSTAIVVTLPRKYDSWGCAHGHYRAMHAVNSLTGHCYIPHRKIICLPIADNTAGSRPRPSPATAG